MGWELEMVNMIFGVDQCITLNPSMLFHSHIIKEVVDKS